MKILKNGLVNWSTLGGGWSKMSKNRSTWFKYDPISIIQLEPRKLKIEMALRAPFRIIVQDYSSSTSNSEVASVHDIAD